MVRDAVAQDGHALQYASAELRGDPAGPWGPPRLAFHKRPATASAPWDCGLGDPSAVVRGDGSVLVAYRTVPQTPPCVKGSAEQIGLLHAPHWTGPFAAVTTGAHGPQVPWAFP